MRRTAIFLGLFLWVVIAAGGVKAGGFSHTIAGGDALVFLAVQLTPTPTWNVELGTPTSTPGYRLYLPLVLKTFPVPSSTLTPTPTATFHVPSSTLTPTPTPTWNVEPGTPTPTPLAIILADGPAGLELVAAPVTIPLTVGHVVYLPVKVQNYHRPITVSAQTLIHTYVDDLTPAEPGVSPPFVVGTLAGPQNELKLQTLRLRAHPLALTFTTVGQVANLSHTLTLEPAVQPHTPLFGLHGDPYYNGLPQPFIRVWGPDCGSCPTTPGDPPGSTRDVACAKQLNDSCNCHPFQEVFDAEADTRVRRRAPDMQRYASQFLRSIGGWGGIQHQPGQYLWDGLDWLFTGLSPQERDYAPLFSGIMDGNFGWMTCPQYTNPDGSVGFFDPDNAYLVAQYRAHVQATTARYAPDLRFVELSNEPAAEFYLCPCVAPGGTCTATSGPNQPACLLGPNSPEFVATYGDLLFTATDIAAEEMAAANPEALAITGALDLPPNDFGLSLTTQNLITRGLLLHDNVAIGIHQYPYLYPPNWISPPLNCAYYQKPGDPYWLPAGCETAPPFADYTTPAGRPIPARYAWQQFDQRVDVSNLLHDAEVLGVLDRLYFFDTELHAGWHDGDPTTTPAREAMAGLRIGAINAHQRVLGSEFVFAPADPAAYNLLVKYLAGATPLYAWDAPLLDADYSGLVYKLFTRGREDVIALWSNAETTQTLTLSLAPDATSFQQVTLTRFADAQGPLAITTTNLSAPPATIAAQPLREFYFLSVISDRPGFGWLAGLAAPPITPTPTATPTPTPTLLADTRFGAVFFSNELNLTDPPCADLQRLGVRSTFFGAWWGLIEPQPGQYDWSSVDGPVDAVLACGCGLEPVIKIASMGRGRPETPPTDLAAYSHFVFHLAQHLKGRVHAYAIENEIDKPRLDSWTAEVYGPLRAAAYAAIKAADPDAQVLDSGLTMGAYLYARANELYQAGKTQEALAMLHRFETYMRRKEHDLPDTEQEMIQWLSSPTAQRSVGLAQELYTHPATYDAVQLHYLQDAWELTPEYIGWVQSWLAQAGALGKPLEFWEIGFGWEGEEADVPFTEEGHAQGVVKCLVITLGEDASRVIYEPYWEDAVADPRKFGRGLVTPDGPRLASTAYQTLANQLSGYQEAESLDLGSGIWAYRFTLPRGDVYVVWSTVPQTISLPIAAQSVTITDIIGQTTLGDPQALPVGPSPIFVQGNW